jgi:hypothetical protein
MLVFLDEAVGHRELHKKNKEKGAPNTLIITAAALRAANVVRYVLLYMMRCR